MMKNSKKLYQLPRKRLLERKLMGKMESMMKLLRLLFKKEMKMRMKNKLMFLIRIDHICYLTLSLSKRKEKMPATWQEQARGSVHNFSLN
jgi:hypothetical protein